jgi:hypothetical protein
VSLPFVCGGGGWLGCPAWSVFVFASKGGVAVLLVEPNHRFIIASKANPFPAYDQSLRPESVRAQVAGCCCCCSLLPLPPLLLLPRLLLPQPLLLHAAVVAAAVLIVLLCGA